MTVIFMADGLEVVEPRNDYQRRDLASWMPGCSPGGPAGSHRNPVIWP